MSLKPASLLDKNIAENSILTDVYGYEKQSLASEMEWYTELQL